MIPSRTNIVLIGMPGSGKSTVGVILAKQTSRDFVDTDVLIQTTHGRALQDIVDTDGHIALREIEESVIADLDLDHHVVSTGGSAVYSAKAMRHLKAHGVIVFLNVDVETIQARVHDFSTRGLAKRADQTFSDLFDERLPLYQYYAEITIDCGILTQEQVCARIVEELRACEARPDC